jgi:23S rRNA (guanosine2251-2'-O)-methyltransferase
VKGAAVEELNGEDADHFFYLVLVQGSLDEVFVEMTERLFLFGEQRLLEKRIAVVMLRYELDDCILAYFARKDPADECGHFRVQVELLKSYGSLFGSHGTTPPRGHLYHSEQTEFVKSWRNYYHPPVIVIAHNIRSLHNVGSIFRNAAAFGIEKLYLTGFTEKPPRKEIAKVALGAERLVSFEAGDIREVIANLKKNGYAVYGLETGGEEIESVVGSRQSKTALVLGNEVEGIDSETVQLLDGLVSIPMKEKQSLNVSVASGVAMYLFTRL